MCHRSPPANWKWLSLFLFKDFWVVSVLRAPYPLCTSMWITLNVFSVAGGLSVSWDMISMSSLVKTDIKYSFVFAFSSSMVPLLGFLIYDPNIRDRCLHKAWTATLSVWFLSNLNPGLCIFMFIEKQRLTEGERGDSLSEKVGSRVNTTSWHSSVTCRIFVCLCLFIYLVKMHVPGLANYKYQARFLKLLIHYALHGSNGLQIEHTVRLPAESCMSIKHQIQTTCCGL